MAVCLSVCLSVYMYVCMSVYIAERTFDLPLSALR